MEKYSYLYLILIFWKFQITYTRDSILFSRNCQNTQFECDNGNCIDKIEWCQSYRYNCIDRSDKRNCNEYYPNCGSDQSYCVTNRKCIPFKWICDGFIDCADGSDEHRCLKGDFRISDILEVNLRIRKALLWLNKQRSLHWDWGKDTSRAIVTLRLSDNNGFDLSNITTEVMVRQMKLQLSEMLLKNERKNFQTYEFASYIHSLLATCSDPRNFQGLNLVKMLEEKMENTTSINPMVALVLCNCNKSLPLKHVFQLKELLSKNNLHESLDFRAYCLMALTCLKNANKSRQKHFFKILNNEDHMILNSNSNQNNNFSLDTMISDSIQQLKRLQKKDGSFGTIYTTALIIHAFLSTENMIIGNEWNVTQAFRYLISQQLEDGSFGDFLATYLILPLLNGQTFVNLGNLNCSFEDSRIKNLTVQEQLDLKNVAKHRVEYFIFIGKNKDIVFGLSVKVPINSTFYDVMRLAAELDPRFRFKYIDYPWGKYIYSIFGLVNNPESRNYWKLYKGEQNGSSPSLNSEQSPDKVISEEETYIFWYKAIYLS